MNRRRVLSILAASVLAPLPAAAIGPGPARWDGTALGADVRVTLEGRGADAVLAELPALLADIEGRFSLHRPSELSALNARGSITASPWMLALLDCVDDLHGMTGGAFDPSVQPLWRALAEGGDTVAAAASVGWNRVARQGGRITLAHGQALTLNGIAQGFAADLVRSFLRQRGFARALVDLGEFAALGGPHDIGIADHRAGIVATRRLEGTALAVSSPGALLVGGRPHILHPRGTAPRWATVAVQAHSAAVADGLSTALVFAGLPEIDAILAARTDVLEVMLVDAGGDLVTCRRPAALTGRAG